MKKTNVHSIEEEGLKEGRKPDSGAREIGRKKKEGSRRGI